MHCLHNDRRIRARLLRRVGQSREARLDASQPARSVRSATPRPGLGITLSEQARAWTADNAHVTPRDGVRSAFS